MRVFYRELFMTFTHEFYNDFRCLFVGRSNSGGGGFLDLVHFHEELEIGGMIYDFRFSES